MDLRLLEYLAPTGHSPFTDWFMALDHTAAGKVKTALDRLRAGNDSNVKGLGGGIAELKIHFGPGYRVYIGRDGKTIIILLGGGTKHKQAQDIARARERWADYQARAKTTRG